MRHHARQDPDLVRLLALRGEARLARPAAIEIALDVGLGERDQRRTTVDHAADRNPVAFAKGCDAEQMAEGVKGHLPVEGLRQCRVSTWYSAWRTATSPALTAAVVNYTSKGARR